MSRKRSKKAPEVVSDVTSSDVGELDAIVDEEVLAEGSGPIATAPAVSDEELAASAEPVDHLVAIELSSDLDEQELGLTDDEEIDGAIEAEGEAATLPTAAAAMDTAELKKLVEALVFASDKPVTVQRLRQLTRVSDTKRLEGTLHELQSDYAERGLILTSVSGGWQFRTRPQFSAWVQQLIAGRPVRLTRAQLETLAIIAYRQPITRPEIDDIRGVDSSATLKLLLDRTLIRVLGKKEEVGRPLLYGTTKEFLDFFSLGDLRELPTLREYSELSDESRQVMSDRLGIEPDGTVEYSQGDDIERPESIEPVADASTLSDLAEKYLREEREAEANATSSIDVDAMPGILADLHGDSIVEGDSLSAEPLITDDIVDADDAIDPDAFGANEPE